jgi:two-component system CheB/CheR fusion protein
VLGVSTDVTEGKLVEQRLRSSEERYRALVDLSPDAVIVQRNNVIVFCNSRSLELFGAKTPEELVGRNVLDFVPPEDVRPMVERLDPLKPGISLPIREFRLRRLDGRIVASEAAGVRIDFHGQPALQVIVRDVSERKRVEDERTRLLAELRTANEQLAEADRRKNDFMATLSHELRNPLAPIRNSLYILDRAAPNGDQARRAKATIDRQVDQLARLVDDLLDVTRVTRNKIHLQRQPVDLGELVARTAEDHRAEFDKAGVHLEVQAAPATIHVDADWNRLAQTVGNLLQNAEKFTPEGGRVTLAVEADAVSNQAVVRVTDTGAGMTPETIARLFQPFMQADRSLDRSKGGLGLGLALVKGLVELHGGSVAATSDGLGRGSQFTVRLPLHAAIAKVDERAKDAVATVCRRVLIIEDNDDAAESLRDVLEFDGHQVEVAGDGNSGLARARQLRPDLVLCDIGLPGMDGYEVAQAFRSEPALRSVHLVALSGYALPEDLERAQAAGFDRHIAKPLSIEKVKELYAALACTPVNG